MHGRQDQKEYWLPKIASGEVIVSFALTEPEAGSDAASLKATAIRDGDHYIVNGTKRYITNANKAHAFTLMARTDPKTPGAKGVSAFVVPRDIPGIHIGKPEKKMGQQGAHICDVVFDDARIPADCLLGAEEGKGFVTAMQVLERGRLHISAVCIGVADRLVEDSVKYAAERKQFGAPIGNLQLVQAMLADSKMEAYAGRCMVIDAARRRDAGEDVATTAPAANSSAPKPSAASPTVRCRCMAARAMSPTTASSASTATSASSASTKAPARSSRSSSRATCSGR